MAPRVFLSFWDVCLDNLPTGRFERRALAAPEAVAMIGAARAKGTLCCVSKDDLLAPYKARRRRDHEALCAVLRRRYDFPIAFENFLCPGDEAETPLQTIAPLGLARLEPGMCLPVVGCSYEIAQGEGKSETRLAIAEDSVTFDLIEALGGDENEGKG